MRRFLTIAATAMILAACEDDPIQVIVPVPTGLTLTQASLTQINLSWTGVSGATGYAVQRSQAGGAFANIGGAITTTSYQDAGVSAGVAYTYQVAAVIGSDTGAYSATAQLTTGLQAATLSGNIAASRTLYKDTVYKISGFVKVQGGAVLTIQPGTRLIGDTTVAGSSLWILRGAQIQANGTAAEPIVFTSARAAGNRKAGDWGGVVIVGNGIINRTGTVVTEGPAGGQETYSGGNNNADNSGTLRYVRIEFAGYDVSGGGGSELNGLSLYAVGSGTTVEYVEVLAGLDDSFEWWGGAVDGRYLISYEAGDDNFDWSEGFTGRLQFLIGYMSSRYPQNPGSGVVANDPQGIEADGCAGTGCTNGQRSAPFSTPVVANMTLIGMGAAETQASGGNGMVLRRGTGGFITNSIVGRWKGVGISVRDVVTDTLRQRDTLQVVNVLLVENVADYEAAGTNFGQAANFAGDNHRTAATAASLLTNLTAGATLNFTPVAASAATTGGGTVALPAGRTAGFFGGTMANTTYVGAVDPAGPQWYAGWSLHVAN